MSKEWGVQDDKKRFYFRFSYPPFTPESDRRDHSV